MLDGMAGAVWCGVVMKKVRSYLGSWCCFTVSLPPNRVQRNFSRCLRYISHCAQHHFQMVCILSCHNQNPKNASSLAFYHTRESDCKLAWSDWHAGETLSASHLIKSKYEVCQLEIFCTANLISISKSQHLNQNLIDLQESSCEATDKTD